MDSLWARLPKTKKPKYEKCEHLMRADCPVEEGRCWLHHWQCVTHENFVY